MLLRFSRDAFRSMTTAAASGLSSLAARSQFDRVGNTRPYTAYISSQYPTVKRVRTCAGFSSSSMKATA